MFVIGVNAVCPASRTLYISLYIPLSCESVDSPVLISGPITGQHMPDIMHNYFCKMIAGATRLSLCCMLIGASLRSSAPILPDRSSAQNMKASTPAHLPHFHRKRVLNQCKQAELVEYRERG